MEVENHTQEKMKKKCLLIVFEGQDRSGKSTQIKKLHEYLNVKNLGSSKMIRFPERESLIGKSIDSYLSSNSELDDNTIHMLFCTNRWEHKNWILKTLSDGINVIVDRYAFSGVAYSVSKGQNINWCKNGDIGLPQPDIVFFQDIVAEEAAKRGDYGQERYEKLDFQLEVMKTYINHLYDKDYWINIDPNNTVDNVSQSIIKEYENYKNIVSTNSDELKNKFYDDKIKKLWMDDFYIL